MNVKEGIEVMVETRHRRAETSTVVGDDVDRVKSMQITSKRNLEEWY